MSLSDARYKIVQLRNRYIMLRLLEALLLSLAAIFVVLMISYFFNVDLIIKILSTSVAITLIVVERIVRYQLLRLNDQLFVQHLNAVYPQLEQSADLILADSELLTDLENLQLQKTIKQFEAISAEVKIPNAVLRSFAVVIFCAASYFVLTSFSLQFSKPRPSKSGTVVSVASPKIGGTPTINLLTIKVTPPPYTTIQAFESNSADLKIPENSKVTWSVKFSSPVKGVKILLSGKDSISLVSTNDVYKKSLDLNESCFYQIQWSDDNKISRSDYFKIEILKDQIPKVTIDNLGQFTKLTFSNPLKVQVKSTLADDYGLTNSRIIATVSKGTGESVKFREEKLYFDSPTKIVGAKINALVTFDLVTLGMEPGDELYFYVEAFDNKKPLANYNRTETFFIALQDTTKQEVVADDGLGVDLMPEYFRSQRQIIIDTEKLLKERKKKSVQEFKSTSNELGYDQKVLRLRYGQFLGEEFEGQIGKGSVTEADSHENTIEKFGHAHDKENEHNLVAEKKSNPAEHQHEGEAKDDAKENPLEAFAHNHDNGEQATFFVQSVRAKLKAALTEMWDAELQLRLNEPEKSLPYQYIALKLLKEISNDSRIYVHRTGFDPPPLKEEKRLTGDLKEIHNSNAQSNDEIKDVYPEIRKSIHVLEVLLNRESFDVSKATKDQLHKAGQELALIALNEPGRFLETLTILKKIEDDQFDKHELAAKLREIQKVFLKVLPEKSSSPTKDGVTTHNLDQQFIERLKALRHE